MDSEYKISDLIERLKRGTKQLNNMSKSMEIAWDPNPKEDPRKIHNMYVRNLINAYTNKFCDLSEGILFGIESSNYLVYALCGRALIETTATLRYYNIYKYKPLLDKETLNLNDFKKLLEIDDKHLRGGRFDWESFMLFNYKKLKDIFQSYCLHKFQINIANLLSLRVNDRSTVWADPYIQAVV